MLGRGLLFAVIVDVSLLAACIRPFSIRTGWFRKLTFGRGMPFRTMVSRSSAGALEVEGCGHIATFILVTVIMAIVVSNVM